MNKLSRFFDNTFLKIGVAFAILFTALYPKLPSIGISHTWVYIRLEDFLIALLVFVWCIMLIRKKITLPFSLATPIVVYWVIGLCSLIFSLIFIGPHLANFFPKIAALQYIRRIEYMILFFVSLSTVKSEKDIVTYVKILFATVIGVVIYGFGQRWYILLWQQFPQFFLKYPFCFPSFQTGNEEFAKGIPLCLPSDARITSTFGGHYDLAAYLVLIIPVLFAAFLAFKNLFAKFFALILTASSVLLLILTASRISFVAYLFGISSLLIFSRQKKYILPVIILSIVLLMTASQSTAKRFLETIRLASVVENNQGQVVGVTEASLPEALRKKISKNPVIVEAPPPSQNLPVGSSFITLPAAPVATNVAVVKTKAPTDKVKQLNLAYGGEEISTISGTFLVKQALVYDISFTTRFQGEWPNAWGAFLRNPLLGSGYSSITLATDSDYFRTLGETGVLGFVSFAVIFMYLGILLKQSDKHNLSPMTKYFACALAGGTIGLFLNATFIDVFEASKVAEPLWMLTGIGAGGLLLKQKSTIDYKLHLKNIFTSNIMIAIYLFIIMGIVFFPSMSNFFTADDFTWLRWAGESSMREVRGYFTDAHGFFYRPLDKLIVFILFSISAFKPEGYHLFILILHFLVSAGVYLLLKRILGKKFWSFVGALLFLVLPAHGENVYWFSTISVTLSTCFIIYAVIAWLKFREKSFTAYIYAIILSILAFFSYEMAIILPGLLLISDFFISKPKKLFNSLLYYIPFLIIIPGYLYIRKISHAVSFGGDYAYSAPHFIPNFFGNMFGYIGIFISGEYFFPAYNILRTNLKAYPFQVLGILLTSVIAVTVVLILKRDKWVTFVKGNNHAVILYGMLFAVVSLLPFIGLGNISERYIYLASVGFVIFFSGIVKSLCKCFEDYGKKRLMIASVVVSVLILTWYAYLAKQEAVQWKTAGDITRETLSILRNKYADIPPNADVYFVNVPIRNENAWVFPVGLPDALWFVYRDSSPRIFQVATIKDAKEMSKNSIRKAYIFTFDKKGNLGVVE